MLQCLRHVTSGTREFVREVAGVVSLLQAARHGTCSRLLASKDMDDMKILLHVNLAFLNLAKKCRPKSHAI